MPKKNSNRGGRGGYREGAGRKKVITDERLRKRPVSLSLNAYEEAILKDHLEFLRETDTRMQNAIEYIIEKYPNLLKQ